MKKLLFIIGFISIGLTLCTKGVDNSSNELLIIKKGALLFQDETTNSKVIKKLDFFDTVFLISKGKNNRVQIQTGMSEKGWIDSQFTSFIPSDWKRITNFNEISIAIPSTIQSKISTGKWEKNQVGNKIIQLKQDRIYTPSFNIIITRSDETFTEVITKQKEADIALNKKNSYIEKVYKGKKIIFKNDTGMDFAQNFLLIIQNINDNYISINISSESTKPTFEEIGIILKILFSFQTQ